MLGEILLVELTVEGELEVTQLEEEGVELGANELLERIVLELGLYPGLEPEIELDDWYDE